MALIELHGTLKVKKYTKEEINGRIQKAHNSLLLLDDDIDSIVHMINEWEEMETTGFRSQIMAMLSEYLRVRVKMIDRYLQLFMHEKETTRN